jgi:RND superfamily putative drug exporter
VGRRPLPWVLGALTVLVTLALPVLDMRTWPEDAGSQPTDYTFRRAYDLVAAEYGAGANGPLLVALDLKRMHAAAVRDLPEQIAAAPGVVAVSPVRSAPSGAAAVLVAEPAWGPQDERASALVDRLRADVLPDGAYLTGRTAVFVDITDLLAERLWTVVGFVVSVSVVLLTLVFRSLVVPVKAALMNLLSIGAAYGVVTAVFQWGWGAELLGVTDPVPVSSWLPVLMFAILFGLSMDYEVFLLSRVRESWLATGDPRGSVVDGLAATGRVISIAATIMVAVFLGFAFETDLTVKMVGVGMAAAVLIDATLVRLVLVPGTMALLGAWNWWLPSRVDRMLPTVEIEGSLAGVGR